MPTAPRILIIRPSALGDVARTVPCLVSLRRAYPEADIHWLVGSAFADAVRHHPALDKTVPFDRKDKASVWPLLRRLRGSKYDLVFDLQGLARSGLFAFATRAQRRVGYANAAELGWLGVNRRHPVDKSRHAIDRMMALLAAEQIQPSFDLTLHVGEDDRDFAETFRQKHGLIARAFACVAPTAQWGCKCWPIDRFAQVAARLADHPELDERVVVLAAPHERQRVQPLLDRLGDRAVLPETRVGQLMAIIGQAKLLVCNDSAPLHLAVGLATPTVSLFGPTDPALVGPPPKSLIPSPGASTAPTKTSASNANDHVGVSPANALAASGGHVVLRSPSAVGKTYNYRRHRDDDSLIAELTLEQVWSAVAEALVSE